MRALLAQLDGEAPLMAALMYGCGLRLMECLRLRIQDVDFTRGEITVRDGKRGKDRVTMLAATLAPALTVQIGRVRRSTSTRPPESTTIVTWAGSPWARPPWAASGRRSSGQHA